LDRHLIRLGASAEYFNYPVDLHYVQNRLEDAAADFPQMPQRVRLLIARDGKLEIEAAPLVALEPEGLLRVKLASKPVNSADVFLYHKTTQRQIYESARLSCPDCDDVLLWNERGELTESCIANLVVEMDGQLLTPPVDSGLLAGTFRDHLLELGKIMEHKILIRDLEQCQRIFLINSVRKWQEAQIA
jgi:branched-subunit amino acid aminotransferase/4-amino-4-deoxychorismate lyase